MVSPDNSSTSDGVSTNARPRADGDHGAAVEALRFDRPGVPSPTRSSRQPHGASHPLGGAASQHRRPNTTIGG